MTVAVLDLGMGNVGSVANMVQRLGWESAVVTEPSQLSTASRLILPGVGAFDEAMARLSDRGFRASLDAFVAERDLPVLGICLGMQLIASRSEEGVLEGLGWVPGVVRRLASDAADHGVKIPHMGWSRVTAPRPHPLVDQLAEDARFYFVHSYAVHPDDEADVVLEARYGGRRFVAGVARGHVMGVQFHPEKSHRHGMAILRSFLELAP